MTDYTPTVTRQDIDRIAKRDYPECSVEQVWEVLKRHGYGESYRVYAAALKEGEGNFERLKQMIDLANTDFRDLLMVAEYPAQSREGYGYHRPEVIQSDKDQYYEWFRK